MQCTEEKEVNQVCTFKNLLLFQGELLYVVEYPDEAGSIEMPNPTVFDLEAETLSIIDYAVPNIVHRSKIYNNVRIQYPRLLMSQLLQKVKLRIR